MIEGRVETGWVKGKTEEEAKRELISDFRVLRNLDISEREISLVDTGDSWQQFLSVSNMFYWN